jgi:large subunit ribosomal protein L23
MQPDPHRIIRRPIVTEKGMAVKETQIKDAVQKVFKVKVAAVRTANFFGKMRRRGMITGYRRDWKKAYVKLAPGEKMIEYAENL